MSLQTSDCTCQCHTEVIEYDQTDEYLARLADASLVGRLRAMATIYDNDGEPNRANLLIEAASAVSYLEAQEAVQVAKLLEDLRLQGERHFEELRKAESAETQRTRTTLDRVQAVVDQHIRRRRLDMGLAIVAAFGAGALVTWLAG